MATPDAGGHVEGTDAFVGRAGLLADLLKRIRDGQSVLLVGPAGVGKSRLAAETLRALPDRASETLLGSAGTERLALGLFIADGTLTAGGPADPSILFDRYLTRWRRTSRALGRVLIWVDDVAHVDDLSVALLRQAVAMGFVQLVTTSRTSEGVPQDLLAAGATADIVPVAVEPLGERDSYELARLSAGARVGEHDLERIVASAEGYPLYIRALAQNDGSAFEGCLDVILDAHLAALDPDARRLAELIAAAEPADWRLFEPEQDTLVELLRNGIVVWSDRKHVRLVHPLYTSLLLRRVGRVAAHLYASLVERSAGLDLDVVVLADWMMSAGIEPDVRLAQDAVRRALERADPMMASRLARFAGDQRDLITGQSFLMEGQVGEGLQVLDAVQTHSASPLVRAEAASASARHVGLTQGDMAGAHLILDRAEATAPPGEARRLLLRARLWLWIFGSVTPEADGRLPEELTPAPEEPAWLSLDILLGGCAVMHQISGVSRLDGVRAMLPATEREVAPDGMFWARARAVEAGCHVHGGDLPTCLNVLGDALDDVRAASPAALRLIAANTAFYAAMAGRFGLAARAAQEAFDVRCGDDAFRFGEQTRLFHEGNHVLCAQGPDPAVWAEHRPQAQDGLMVEYIAWARSACLRNVDIDMDRVVQALIDSRSLGWLALLAADCLDNTNVRAHGRIAHAYSAVPRSGLWEVVFSAAEARGAEDPERLLVAASAYAAQGFVTGATRAAADAARAPGASSDHVLESRRVAVRALRRWEGKHPAWVRSLALPSVRALDAVWRVIDGESVAEVSAAWTVSRRTVENHIFRAAHSLGVSGVDGLRTALQTGGC